MGKGLRQGADGVTHLDDVPLINPSCSCHLCYGTGEFVTEHSSIEKCKCVIVLPAQMRIGKKVDSDKMVGVYDVFFSLYSKYSDG